MKSKFVFLFILNILSSCSYKDKYQDADTFNFNDFKEEIKLTGKLLDFNEIIMQPSSIQVYDSVLVTLEYGGEKFCHLFNLNTKTKIGERLVRGQGPDEMLMPQFIDNDGLSIQFIDMASSNIYKYDIEDFINNPTPKPIHRAKLEENINSGMQMLGENLIGYPYFKERQLFVFNMDGKKINEFADFPKSTITYSDAERADAFYMGFTSNLTNKVAICYYMTDLIEIYNSMGEIQKRIHGPEHFFSYFKEIQDEGGVTSRQVRGKNRDSYFSPKNAGDNFFVLYNGGYVDEENHSPYCNKLMSFSWEGVPEYIYILDDAIFTFCVDKKHKKIYGVSNTPDNHIVEYSYE